MCKENKTIYNRTAQSRRIPLPDLPEEAWCDFRRDYESGMTLKEIAEKYFCDPRIDRRCIFANKSSSKLENMADRFGEWASASKDYGFSEEAAKAFKKLYNNHKHGNLYYSVDILYPLVFHYLIAFEEILVDEPMKSWFETETEFGEK